MESSKHPGSEAASADKLQEYLVVYVCLLILAGMQFVLAYQHIEVGNMIFRMFSLALAEAGLSVVFFMQLGSENRTFVVWVAVISLFVLASMQFVWPDSSRMRRDAASSYHTRPAP